MDLNRVMLIGNLTRDPETRNTTTGAQVTSFTIAVNERRSGKGKEEPPMFIKITTWNKTAEIAAQYLRKGSGVLVEGRLKIEEYDSRDGQKRRDPVIVADSISLGPKPRDGEGGSGGGNYGGGGSSNYRDRDEAPRSSGAQQSRSSSSPSPARREYEPPADQDYDQGGGGTEDDLPF